MSQAVRPLSPKLQKIAIEELNEDPLKIPGFLHDFKNWIKEQKYLHVRHDDDQFLIQFLRASRYDLQEAEKKLDYFHAFRTRYPEFFETNVDSPKFRATHDLGWVYWGFAKFVHIVYYRKFRMKCHGTLAHTSKWLRQPHCGLSLHLWSK